MESAEQPIVDLHKGVSKKLNEVGHFTTPESVNPHDESALDKIHAAIGTARHDMEGIARSTVSDDESNKIRVAEDKTPTLILNQKLKSLKFLNKAA